MRWLKKALTITQLGTDTFYTIVDPYEFYEWRYTGTIPAGTEFSKYLPPTDIISTGKVVACAKVNENLLQKKGYYLELQRPISGSPTIRIGQIPSAKELKSRFDNMYEKFKIALSQFVSECKISRFYTTADSVLHKISYADQSSSYIEDFGKMKDIMKTIEAKREELKKISDIKNGRAHEMVEFVKYSQALAFINSLHLQGNSDKMNYLISVAGVSPAMQRRVSWKDCYLEFSPIAKGNYDIIVSAGKKTWMQSSSNLKQ